MGDFPSYLFCLNIFGNFGSSLNPVFQRQSPCLDLAHWCQWQVNFQSLVSVILVCLVGWGVTGSPIAPCLYYGGRRVSPGLALAIFWWREVDADLWALGVSDFLECSGSFLSMRIEWAFYLFIYLFILLFRAALAAYGDSQARDLIGSTCHPMPQPHQIWTTSATYLHYSSWTMPVSRDLVMEKDLSPGTVRGIERRQGVRGENLLSSFLFLFLFFFFLPFLGPLPWHMEVPRLGV